MLEFKTISKCKRSAIQEAVIEWKKAKNKNTVTGREDFQAHMKSYGWEHIGSGGYKVCLSKSTIILKYARNPNCKASIREVEREFEQWECLPSKFRRHLAKTYILANGMLVQDKVLQRCSDIPCIEFDKLIKEYPNIKDAWGNHGHSLRGKLKFFDWVYNRHWDMVEDPCRKLIEK